MAGFWLDQRAASRGYRLIGYDTVGSTSEEAAEAARAGDVGEVWFAAMQQTAGRGRRGRPWQTARGNMAASLLLVPEVDPALTATLGFVAGVALHDALRRAAPGLRATTGIDGVDGGTRVALKWPNDILADGAKLAGILLEAVQRPKGGVAVVIGFGVNVVSAPEGLPYPATCLRDMNCEADSAALLGALSATWLDAFDLWDSGRGAAAVLAHWRQAAAGIGADVVVNREGEIVRGVFEAIDDSGRLIVRKGDDTRITITAGDVHFGVTASLGA